MSENNLLPQTDILAAMARQDFQAAIALAEQQWTQAPHCYATLSNGATAALMAADYDKAIDLAIKILPLKPDFINAYDVLSHAYGRKGDYWSCCRYGAEALRLRDVSITSKYAKLPDLPNISAFRQPENSLQLISFSLYGNDSAYVETAVLNAQIAPQIYPDWVCRFYVDDTVSPLTIARLLHAGAQVHHVDKQAQNFPKTMWRFLALADEQVSRVIFRDADAVISQREAKAVQAWVESGKLFHLIRDYPSHTELILAGLWGAVGGAVPNIRHRIQHYLQHVPPDPRYADQYFLREHVWLLAKQSACIHDSLFGFSGSLSFPENSFANWDITHIGKDEGHYPVTIEANFPDGTPVKWTLRSDIRPLLNEDYSPHYDTQMREICQYTSTLQGGKVVCHIPQRYHEGIYTGHSEISLHVLRDRQPENHFYVNVKNHPDGTTIHCTIRSQLPPITKQHGHYTLTPKREVKQFIATVQNGQFDATLESSQFWGLQHGLTQIELNTLP